MANVSLLHGFRYCPIMANSDSRLISEHDIVTKAQEAGKVHAALGQPSVPHRVAAVLTRPTIINLRGPWIHPCFTALITAEYLYGYNREQARRIRELGYEPTQESNAGGSEPDPV